MIEIEAKSILNRKKQRDSWFLDEYTLNPYSGCSFNCLYCYIRGSKYGIHMEKKLGVKKNALALLEKQLAARAKKQQYGIIVLASATDPYLQIEEELQHTRKLLEVIEKYRFPVHIITKSGLVLRDLDILKEIDRKAILPLDLEGDLKRGCIITFSFSTVDEQIGKIFEPGAPSPMTRLEAMNECGRQGMLTGVSMMPLLPYISDKGGHLELMMEKFKANGASYVMPADLTLYGNEKSSSRTLVLKAVEKHYPELLPKYQKFFSGKENIPSYYREAFYKKMKELGERYELRNRIIT